jgi:ABC-type transport system involved in multi-copper enzyme maturation permease subunit
MQTRAIFIAAYRELSARKLFWLALGTTLLVVGLFASLGINEDGVSWFGWTGDSPFFNSSVMSPETFYKLLFANFGIDWWLGLLATILALVTTCGIVPDLVAPGSVDLLLAKPISRARLFLTKYATGLLFAAVQVSAFTTATFFVIGIRGGAWEWSLFLAVPIVTVTYSFLFSICALVGMITRSSLAALIITLMAWAAISTVAMGESLTRHGLLANTMDIAACTEELANTDEPPDEDRKEELEARSETLREQRDTWLSVHGWFYGFYLCLPKTGETLDALNRVIVDANAFGNEDGPRPRGVFAPRIADRREYRTAVETDDASRSMAWIVGTSLIFEAIILAIATRLFVRRDY